MRGVRRPKCIFLSLSSLEKTRALLPSAGFRDSLPEITQPPPKMTEGVGRAATTITERVPPLSQSTHAFAERKCAELAAHRPASYSEMLSKLPKSHYPSLTCNFTPGASGVWDLIRVAFVRPRLLSVVGEWTSYGFHNFRRQRQSFGRKKILRSMIAPNRNSLHG